MNKSKHLPDKGWNTGCMAQYDSRMGFLADKEVLIANTTCLSSTSVEKEKEIRAVTRKLTENEEWCTWLNFFCKI